MVADDDRGAGKATQRGKDGKLTWRFKAENVRDVTWATSTLPLGRDDGGGRRAGRHRRADTTMIYSFYRPRRGGRLGRGGASYASRAITIFSRYSGPIPTRT